MVILKNGPYISRFPALYAVDNGNYYYFTPKGVETSLDGNKHTLIYKANFGEVTEIDLNCIKFDSEKNMYGEDIFLGFYIEDSKADDELRMLRGSIDFEFYEALYYDGIAPYMELEVHPYGREEVFYRKGTKVQIDVLTTKEYGSRIFSENPNICLKFGDGVLKQYSQNEGWSWKKWESRDDEGREYIFKYTYEYEIKEEDIGEMTVYFSGWQDTDHYDNVPTFNSKYSVDGEGYKPGIFADSIAPTGKITYVTNEDRSVTATVEFEEENITITNNEGKNTYTFTETGEFIFTFKDQAGNEGSAKAEIKNSLVSNPELKFKTLETKEESGKVYVKVGQDSTVASIKSDIDTAALAGKTVEIENLTEDGKIKTGSTITIDGNVQCVIVVSGDVDGDGKIDFIGDIIRANNYRLGLINIDVEQELASDIDDDGKVDFIKDLIRINNYRLGLIDSL